MKENTITMPPRRGTVPKGVVIVTLAKGQARLSPASSIQYHHQPTQQLSPNHHINPPDTKLPRSTTPRLSGEVEGRRGSGWRRRARLVTARAALGLSGKRAEIVRLSREEEQVKKINDTDTEGVKKPYTRKQAAIEGGFSYLNYVDHGITPSDDSEPFAKKARDYQEAMKRQHVEFDEATTKARFEHWMEEYGRSYDTEEEKARRYEIFKKVAVWADEVNAFEPRSVPFGPNGLADMTDEERELMDPHCGSSNLRGGGDLRVRAEDLGGGHGLRDSSGPRRRRPKRAGARISARRKRIPLATVTLGTVEAWKSGRKIISSAAAAEDSGRDDGPRGGGGLGVQEAEEDSDVDSGPMGSEVKT
uniref:Cathepsin propeptide inhibitor domain-containing protein n=1 Tax=Oryza punctata TaxID=4537 RepID=A0A0E0L475_ORYPU